MKKLLLVFALLLALCGALVGCDDGGATNGGATNGGVTNGGVTNGGATDGESSHTHVFGEWEETKAPTCVKKGEETRSCACGESETRKVSATGHTFGEWVVTKDATCVTSGSQRRLCEMCFQVEIEIVPIDMSAHAPAAAWITNGTYHWHECTNSGCDVKLDKAEHVPSTEWMNDATCHWRVCTVDGCAARVDESTHLYNDKNTCTACRRYKDEGLKFTLSGNEYTVSGYTGTERTVVIPPTYNGKAVTSISSYAFRNCSSITSISIPASVTSIGRYAFYYCSGLTSISIPVSVMSIGEDAFYNCSGLTALYINSLAGWCGIVFENVYANPLYYAKNLYLNGNLVRNLEIPSDVTSIGKYAFSGCSSITSISIPASVTAVGFSAFSGCGGLTSIMLPFVGENLNGTSNTNFGYIFGASSYFYNDGFVPTTLETVVVTGGAFVASFAFENCSSITSISIPASVTTVGERAFRGCNSLAIVILPFVGASLNGTSNMCFEYVFGGRDYIPVSLKTVVITGGDFIVSSAFSGCSGLTSISIPASVKSIGSSAFSGCSGLTSITLPFVGASLNGTSNTHFGYIFGASSYSDNKNYIPTSLKTVVITGGTSIGFSAFEDCSGLTSISIPSSVTSIGEDAFYNCSGLTSITVEEGNTVYHATQNCLIETASKTLILGCKNSIIPTDGSVTFIGSYAFYNCSGLISISIPVSVRSIGFAAFSGCSGLTSISIPSGVISIGYGAFSDCSSLESITLPFVGESPDISGYHFGYIFGASSYSDNDDYVPTSLKTVVITGGTSIGSDAFYNCSGLTSISVPASVTSIGDEAFYKCSGLTTVTFGEGSKLETIGDHAFYGCSTLTGISVPASVTSIGDEAFSGCSGLKTVTFGEGSKLETIGDHAFYGCSTLTGISVPASVTSIGDEAFSGCSGLTSITLPFVGASLKGTSNTHLGYIFGAGSYSYNDDYVPTSLKTVVITGGTSIGSSAFYGCSGLASISIPASVTSIGSSAFSGCSGLTSISIPASVTTIGSSAFEGCSGLTSIRIPASVTSIGSSAFYNCNGLVSITLPFVGASRSASGYQSHFGYIFGYSSSSSSNSGYHYYDSSQSKYFTYNIPTSLKEVVIAGVTSIGSRAFYKCSNLTSITIPASVTSIGSYAFEYCSGLTSISIPASVTSIGSYAFFGCSGLTSISIPASVTSIGNYAFEYCSGLTTVTFGENSKLTSIGSYAFFGCSGLTSISIPASVTSIGSDAFFGCSGLKTVTFGENSKLTSIGSSAFSGCSGLTVVHITDLTAWCNISFGDSNSNPLYYAKNLYLNGNLVRNLEIPSDVTSIGKYAFSGCSSITSITVEEGNTVYHSAGNCLIETANKTLVAGFKNSVIPTDGSVTSIGSYAFDGCSGLTSISIPASVTSIGSDAFRGCSGLKTVKFEENSQLTSIGDDTFRGCSGLTSIRIPASVTSIGKGAFSGCSGLETVMFEATTGWRRYYSSTNTSGESISNLGGYYIAAMYLTSTYDDYYWRRS